MSIFLNLVQRLRRTNWGNDAQLLSEEIIAALSSNEAAVFTSPVTIVQQKAGVSPLTLVMGTGPDGETGNPIHTVQGGHPLPPVPPFSPAPVPGFPPYTVPDGLVPNPATQPHLPPPTYPPLPTVPPFVVKVPPITVPGSPPINVPPFVVNPIPPNGVPQDDPVHPPPPVGPPVTVSGSGGAAGLRCVVVGKTTGTVYAVTVHQGSSLAVVASVTARAANVRTDDVVSAGTEWPISPDVNAAGQVTGGVFFPSVIMLPGEGV